MAVDRVHKDRIIGDPCEGGWRGGRWGDPLANMAAYEGRGGIWMMILGFGGP